MELEKDVLVSVVLEYLKHKQDLTDLEADIISTAEKYFEDPFDRKGAERKIIENNCKYNDIYSAIILVPGVSKVPFCQVTDEGVKENLKMQIEAMCFKEYEAIFQKSN